MHPFEDKEVVIFHVYHLSIKFPGMSRVLHKDLSKVETPIHDSIRKLVTWECKEHGVKILNVLTNPKGSVGR